MPLETGKWTAKVLAFCKKLSLEASRKLPFQKPVFEGIENSGLISQAESYRKIKEKIPTWWERGDLYYPDSTAAEQCTSEWVSRWKSTQIPLSKLVFVDACSGLGVDAWFLGRTFREKFLFETDLDRARALKQNLSLLGYDNFQVFQSEFLPSARKGIPEISNTTLVYVDPDRRPSGPDRKWKWQESSPDLKEIYNFLFPTRASLLVKLSPMDNLEEVLIHLKGAKKVVTVSLQNEVKEVLVFWDFSVLESVAKRFVVEIQKSGRFRELEIPEVENTSIEFSQPHPGGFILDPWSCLRKGNQSLGWMTGKGYHLVGPGTELYYSDSRPVDFPGRVFRIQSIPHELNEFGKRNRKKAMQVICRNFPDKPEALKKKFLWTEGQTDFLLCYGNGRGNKYFIHAQKEEPVYSPDFWAKIPDVHWDKNKKGA